MKQLFFLRAILGLFILTTAISPAADAAQAVSAEERGSVVNSNNRFAWDLYAKLAGKTGNLFFSPYSISTALGMTYAGARGETARQMATVLHFDLPPGKLHPALSDLMGTLNAEGKSYQLSVANALWAQAGYRWEKEFLDVTGTYYGAGLKEVEYIDSQGREQARKTINQWTEEKTGNKITDLIKPGMLDELTRLVLTNAIYFKGKWKLQFKPEETKTQPFYTTPDNKVDVPLMHQLATYRYAENDRVQILELLYAGDDLSMVVLLPRPEHGLLKLEKALLPENLQGWLSTLSKQEVDVFLPRFRMKKTIDDLGKELGSLGMPDAFDKNKADFSGMTRTLPLSISNVVHKAFVDVNEEGTEAAAATAVASAVIASVKSKSRPPPVFRADRPFLFVIRDVRSGFLLFIGRLVDLN